MQKDSLPKQLIKLPGSFLVQTAVRDHALQLFKSCVMDDAGIIAFFDTQHAFKPICRFGVGLAPKVSVAKIVSLSTVRPEFHLNTPVWKG